MLSLTLTQHHVSLLTALIAACALIAATLLSTRRARRESEAVRAAMDTQNGRALGETVHDIAQTVELVQAQGHTNTGELLALHHKADRGIELATAVKQRLDEHIDQVGPDVGALASWVRQQMDE